MKKIILITILLFSFLLNFTSCLWILNIRTYHFAFEQHYSNVIDIQIVDLTHISEPVVKNLYSTLKHINLEYVKDFYIDIQGLDMECDEFSPLFGSGKAFFVFYSNGECVSISETRVSSRVIFDQDSRIVNYADAYLFPDKEQFYALIEKYSSDEFSLNN